MKKSAMLILSIVFLLMSLACEKQNLVPDPTPVDTTSLFGRLDTIWTNKILENLNHLQCENLMFDGSSIYYIGYRSNQAYAISFNNLNGLRNWIWEPNETSLPSSHLYKNKIFLQKEWDIYAINSESGDLLIHSREQKQNDAHSYGQILGDYYYQTIRTKDDNIATLIRSQYDDLMHWDTVYTLRRGPETGGSRPNIQSYILWIHPQSGDSILVFQHRMALPNRVDVVAWNLSKSELLWKRDNVTRDGNSNHQQIFIHDNKAYFGGSVTFFCFDLFNGNIIWQHDAPSGQTPYMITKPTYAESINAIILVGGQKMTAHDVRTGRIIWQVDSPGSINSGSPVYHDKVIYATIAGGLLSAHRATNGQLLWSESSAKTQFQTSSFRGEIAIDREKGILYVTDQDELFAIKVYKD